MDVKMFAAKCFHIGLTVFSEDNFLPIINDMVAISKGRLCMIQVCCYKQNRMGEDDFALAS